MPAQDSIDAMNTQMDVANLYREEVVTDRKVGTIHVLTPILDSGERDTVSYTHLTLPTIA